MAHYFGVHQVIEAGQYIAPLDLDESELEFVDPSAPLVEEERPGLNAATQQALHRYLANPTEENKQALLEQMGIKYDKGWPAKKPNCANWNAKRTTSTLSTRCKPSWMR